MRISAYNTQCLKPYGTYDADHTFADRWSLDLQQFDALKTVDTVSYTHLTLPTIYSV